jgi:hypothetical protein
MAVKISPINRSGLSASFFRASAGSPVQGNDNNGKIIIMTNRVIKVIRLRRKESSLSIGAASDG